MEIKSLSCTYVLIHLTFNSNSTKISLLLWVFRFLPYCDWFNWSRGWNLCFTFVRLEKIHYPECELLRVSFLAKHAYRRFGCTILFNKMCDAIKGFAYFFPIFMPPFSCSFYWIDHPNVCDFLKAPFISNDPISQIKVGTSFGLSESPSKKD